MRRVLVSVIVPAFNAEKTLRRCVDSILVQDFDELELILVDDGSTDKTREIIDEYIKKDGRVKKLFSGGGGAAKARNLGILQARGKYVWFIDADDEILPGAIKKLFRKAEEKKAELVMMSARKIFLDGRQRILRAVKETEEPIAKRNAEASATKREDGAKKCGEGGAWKSAFIRYGVGPWQVFFRRDWWKKCGFSFREGKIHEDMGLMSALTLYTDHYAAVPEVLYNYYETEGSVLHKEGFDPRCFDIFTALKGLYRRFLAVPGAVEKYHDELEWFFIWNLLLDSARDFRKGLKFRGKWKGKNAENPRKMGRKGFLKARKMLQKYFPKWRENRFLKEKSIGVKVRVRLAYLGF